MARIRVWLFSLLPSQDLVAGTMLNVILEKLIGASDTVGNGGRRRVQKHLGVACIEVSN